MDDTKTVLKALKRLVDSAGTVAYAIEGAGEDTPKDLLDEFYDEIIAAELILLFNPRV